MFQERLRNVQEIKDSVDMGKRERDFTVYRSSLLWCAPLREARLSSLR
jgi:hypothetical protein